MKQLNNLSLVENNFGDDKFIAPRCNGVFVPELFDIFEIATVKAAAEGPGTVDKSENSFLKETLYQKKNGNNSRGEFCMKK